MLFHDLYTAVRSDYLTLIDFVIELVDYNLFMSSGKVEAGLVKMTLRQVDASRTCPQLYITKLCPQVFSKVEVIQGLETGLVTRNIPVICNFK